MRVLQILVALLFVQSSTSSNPSNIYKYINSDYNFPKCCEQGFHFIAEYSELSCKKGVAFKLQVGSKYNASSDNCIEILLENSTYNLIVFDRHNKLYHNELYYFKYPLCCPIGRSYNKREHRCVYNSKAKLEAADGIIVSSGMPECKLTNQVVVDYSYSNNNIIVYKNLSVKFVNKLFQYGSYCFDLFSSTLRVCGDSNNICTRVGSIGIPCYKKCCPDGEIYYNKQCVPTFDTGLQLGGLQTHWTNFGVIQIQNDQSQFKELSSDNIILHDTGSVHIRLGDDWRSYDSQDAPYCIETVRNATSSSQQFFVLSKTQSLWKLPIKISVGLTFVSAIFTLLTLIVYLILPEVQILYGRPLLIYLILASIAFLAAIAERLIHDSLLYDSSYCVVIGFILLYIYLAYFTWLNIIGLDLWLTFGRFGVNSRENKRINRKRFIWYNLYGWGLPTIVILVTFTIYKTKCLPDYLVPHIGTLHCFFDAIPGTYDRAIYYETPKTILVVVNCIFFIRTVLYCFQVKNEIKKMNEKTDHEYHTCLKMFNADKEKLAIFLKFGTIMGVLWLLNVVTYLAIQFTENPVLQLMQYIWLCCNLLPGVYTFCIFILRKKILKSLKCKISCVLEKLL